jgi:transposase
MSRRAVLTDEMWARVEPLLPPVKGAEVVPVFVELEVAVPRLMPASR